MKPALLSLLLSLPAFALGQTAPPAETAPAPEVKLTEAQMAHVLSELKKLETEISQLRGTNLASILARLREGAASDQAAQKLYLDCFSLVNSSRREETKSEAREREERMKRAIDRKGGGKGAEDDGDFAAAVRLQIQYLILTLEAHEAKEEEFKKMVPKLKSFVGEVIATAPRLKGRALAQINQPLAGGRGGGNPIIEAFQLDRYLKVDKWAARPTDFGAMYTQTIMPLVEEENKTELAGLWDQRINAEAAFRKESMFGPEFELWTKNELPELRWERANYLYQKGADPVSALAEMLKLIRENPSHANAPKWLTELRTMIEKAAPGGATTAELTTAPGT